MYIVYTYHFPVELYNNISKHGQAVLLTEITFPYFQVVLYNIVKIGNHASSTCFPYVVVACRV